MTVDKKYICVFLRMDLSDVQKVVQCSHVCFEVGRRFDCLDERYKILVFGIKSEPKLKKVIEEIKGLEIPCVEFTEPDMDFQLTAVATEPMVEEKKNLFSRYRLIQMDG